MGSYIKSAIDRSCNFDCITKLHIKCNTHRNIKKREKSSNILQHYIIHFYFAKGVMIDPVERSRVVHITMVTNQLHIIKSHLLQYLSFVFLSIKFIITWILHPPNILPIRCVRWMESSRSISSHNMAASGSDVRFISIPDL